LVVFETGSPFAPRSLCQRELADDVMHDPLKAAAADLGYALR